MSVIRHYRERGEDAASAAELLQVVLGDEAVASRLWARFGSLRRISALPVEALAIEEGMGPARAARLHAAFAMGRRAYGEVVRHERIRVPEDAARVLVPRIGHLPHEEVHLLLLDSSGRQIRAARVGQGGLGYAPMDARVILRAALEVGAAAFVLGHNHPSGDPEPSLEDLRATRSLERSTETLGLTLRDHLIVAGDRWISLAKRGELSAT